MLHPLASAQYAVAAGGPCSITTKHAPMALLCRKVVQLVGARPLPAQHFLFFLGATFIDRTAGTGSQVRMYGLPRAHGARDKPCGCEHLLVSAPSQQPCLSVRACKCCAALPPWAGARPVQQTRSSLRKAIPMAPLGYAHSMRHSLVGGCAKCMHAAAHARWDKHAIWVWGMLSKGSGVPASAAATFVISGRAWPLCVCTCFATDNDYRVGVRGACLFCSALNQDLEVHVVPAATCVDTCPTLSSLAC